MPYQLKATFCILFAAVLAVGCTTRIGDFTTVSTKNVDMNSQYQQVGSTEGTDGAFFGQPDMKTAVDNALENSDASAKYLTNARIYTTQYPLYTKVTVEGDAWVPSSGADAGGEIYRLETTEEGKFLVSEDGSEKIKVFSSGDASPALQRKAERSR